MRSPTTFGNGRRIYFCHYNLRKAKVLPTRFFFPSILTLVTLSSFSAPFGVTIPFSICSSNAASTLLLLRAGRSSSQAYSMYGQRILYPLLSKPSKNTRKQSKTKLAATDNKSHQSMFSSYGSSPDCVNRRDHTDLATFGLPLSDGYAVCDWNLIQEPQLSKLAACIDQHCIMPLSPTSHKGSSGRIGIVGGSARYTGAPYYAAMAALHVGADLAYVFCADEAALPIKCYSPELMVIPVYKAAEFDMQLKLQQQLEQCQEQSDLSDDALTQKTEKLIQGMVEQVVSMMDRLHVLIIGPGLGRCPLVMQATAQIILKARERNLAMVLDADALHLLTLPISFSSSSPSSILYGYPKVVLTPNQVEYKRLEQAAISALSRYSNPESGSGENDDEDMLPLRLVFSQNALILKGRHDRIRRFFVSDASVTNANGSSNDSGMSNLMCTEEGGLKRSGGIGDVLAGTLGTFLAWHEILHHANPQAQSVVGKVTSATSPSPSAVRSNACVQPLQDGDVTTPDWMLWSCWTACCLVKRATKRAFDMKHRAMTAPDILEEIGPTFNKMTNISTTTAKEL